MDEPVTTDGPPPDPDAVSITINGRTVAARRGEWIIAAADRADEYIPRFCYHPRMSSVGMCRQCLVEVEGPRGPMMVVSCMTPVAEGQVVRTDTPQVKRAQEGMIELLLANHPLDCPVCDKGGECPLQDQAFSHGAGESRFVEEKRHYEKPIPISDLVQLDRERCILCDRCTRFADEVAGDALIHFVQRGNNTQVLTFPGEPFASHFSGNTVQICPVGALTAAPYRFKARPWDIEQQESTCTTCSVGCRTVVQSSRDEVVRVLGVDSEPVNHGWLCDRGRFDFQAVGAEGRVEQPLIARDGELVETTWAAALEATARTLRMASPGSIAVLGGARGTNEDTFLWARLADALGVTMRDAQLDDGLPASVLGLPAATIAETCGASTVVMLAPDVKEELPVLHLRLRDAALRGGTRIIEVTSHDTGLTPLAWRSVTCDPGGQRAAVAGLLGDPEVAAQLASGPVVVVAGRTNLAENAGNVMSAVDAVLAAVPSARVLPVLRRGNVRGALSMGLAPRGGVDAAAILAEAALGRVECLVLLGADPLADVPDADLARRGLAGARYVVAVDTFLTASSSRADVVLPAAGWAEKDGTTTNLEGRVTGVTRRVVARGTSRPDWMIAAELLALLGHDAGVTSLADVQSLMTESVPGWADLLQAAAPGSDGGILTVAPDAAREPVVDVPPRNSYEFRMVMSRRLWDRAVRTAHSPALAGLAGESGMWIHPTDLERIGAPAGAVVRVTNAHGSTVVRVSPSAAVPRGCALVPFNLGDPDLRDLVRRGDPVTDVRIESI
ncbi:MAG: NADH-quinone oxidoreductase subunit [Actinomycetota bacterium]